MLFIVGSLIFLGSLVALDRTIMELQLERQRVACQQELDSLPLIDDGLEDIRAFFAVIDKHYKKR